MGLLKLGIILMAPGTMMNQQDCLLLLLRDLISQEGSCGTKDSIVNLLANGAKCYAWTLFLTGSTLLSQMAGLPENK